MGEAIFTWKRKVRSFPEKAKKKMKTEDVICTEDLPLKLSTWME